MKKIHLTRASVRQVSAEELSHVQGGRLRSKYDPNDKPKRKTTTRTK